jgi:aspartate/methionine/tyrosine aminotransferase
MPVALVVRKLGQLKSKKYGMAGLVLGYLGTNFVISTLISAANAKSHLLSNSKMARAAASGYRKNENYDAADTLEEYAELLEAQGK